MRKRIATPRPFFLILILGFMVVIGVVGTLVTEQDAPQDTLGTVKEVEVVRVVDGDTVDIRQSDGTVETVRLIGIDAPEIDWDDRTNTECYGWEARTALEEIIEGKTVSLLVDDTQPERDTYDRLLTYLLVSSEDDEYVHVNELLLEEGAAREFVVGSTYRYYDEHVRAEATAREAGKGLWGACR